MRVRVLGPVEVRVADSDDWISPPPKQRTLLALLAVHRGRPVSTDALVEALWGENTPRDPLAQLYTQVTRLRRLAGDREGTVLRTESPGYSLSGDTDLLGFERLAADRTAEADPRGTADRLREALDLWRDQPFADAGECDALTAEAVRLNDLRLDVLDARIEADLDLGRHRELTSELGTLVAQNPYREGFWAQLMLALYRSGRQSEALEAYRTVFQRLDNDLGIAPGRALTELHQQMLTGGHALALGAAPRSRVVPNQLPASVPGFTGRRADLSQLDRSPLTVITGMGGVGKTSLATHWAAQRQDRFPDGRLYVNLRGYDRAEPVDPSTALAGFCRALGVDDIPPDLDGRASLYRSLLAGRSVLVVLDNARTVDQVRPLLPGQGCTTLITSRDDLGGLVAREGAHRVSIEGLSVDEGLELLAQVVGRDRVDPEVETCTEVIDRCAGLPLALRIVGERLQHRALSSASSARDLLDELADQRTRLDALETPGDPASAVRAVFSWSYAALPEDTARLFRLLGLHPGQEFDAHAAANLAAAPLPVVRRNLEHLERAHLITEHRGRFQMHDLLRDYATELARDEPDRVAAFTRLLDYYAHTVAAAADLLEPNRVRRLELDVPPPSTGVTIEEPAQAHRWLESENDGIVEAVRRAAGDGLHAYTWLLCDGMQRFFGYTDRLDDRIAAHRWALASARSHGDVRTRAVMSIRLGSTYRFTEWHDEAIALCEQGVELAREIEDRTLEAGALQTLGVAYAEVGRLLGAHEVTAEVVELFGSLGEVRLEAFAFANLLAMRAILGVEEGDLDRAERILESLRDTGRQRAALLQSLGEAREALGRYEEACDPFTAAHALFRRLGDAAGIAQSLTGLASVQRRLGALDDAIVSARAAITARPRGPVGERARVLGLLALIEASTGDRAAALRRAAEAMEAIDGGRVTSFHVLARLELGEMHLALGDTSAAYDGFTSALEMSAARGYAVLEARARDGLAAVERARPRP